METNIKAAGNLKIHGNDEVDLQYTDSSGGLLA